MIAKTYQLIGSKRHYLALSLTISHNYKVFLVSSTEIPLTNVKYPRIDLLAASKPA